MKIENPSPLQKKIINAIKQEGDVLINASGEDQVVTGFLVPALDHIARQDRRHGTKAIILTPHTERATDLNKWIREVGYHAGIESECVEEKGVKADQKSALLAGPTIIVATPERLSGLMEENRIIFREVKHLIVERADEIQLWDSVDVINKRIIGKCQRIVTVSQEKGTVPDKFESFLNEPQSVGFPKEQDRKEASQESQNGVQLKKDLTQYYIKVPPRMKISTLMAHLENNPSDNVLIFTASRRTADRLYRVFRKSGRRAVSVHDKLDKDKMVERFERFNSGSVQHLIAGEISASELPVDKVSQVINYDVPEQVDEYKLRADLIGNGKTERIVSLVSKQDRSDIKEIIEELGYAPEEIPLPESVNDKKKSRKEKSSSKKTKQKQKRTGQKKTTQKKKKRPLQRPTEEPTGLPRPSYDKLSGGRSGQKKKEAGTGIVGFFKKLFS